MRSLSFSLILSVTRECLFGVKMSRKESRESGQRGNSVQKQKARKGKGRRKKGDEGWKRESVENGWR